MNKKTPQQMAKWAVLSRARAEASVMRGYFLNEVLPALEAEFDRRLGSEEELTLALPEAESFAQAYVEAFFVRNKLTGGR